MKGYIYVLTDTRNNMQYVGQHNGNNKDYWSGGLIPNRIANKHGKNIFIREILESNISSKDELNKLEMSYISKFNTFKNGYNLTEGGDGGGSWIYKKSNEEIKKIAISKSEKMKGRIFSDETIQKMKTSHTNKKLTEEHKKNISLSRTGKPGHPHSEETKKHLSNVKTGIPNPSHSEFMKNNNPAFISIEINGVKYNSIREASDILGLSYATIKGRLNSKKQINWKRL